MEMPYQAPECRIKSFLTKKESLGLAHAAHATHTTNHHKWMNKGNRINSAGRGVSFVL